MRFCAFPPPQQTYDPCFPSSVGFLKADFKLERGATLASETALAIGLAVIGLLIYTGMTAAAYIFTRFKRGKRGASPRTAGLVSDNGSEDVILGDLRVAHAE